MKEDFNSKLQAQHETAIQNINPLIAEGMAWATREQRYDWGKVAATNVKRLLISKEQEALDAIKMIRTHQVGELATLTEADLLRYHTEVLGLITKRFDLMMQVTAQDSPAGAKDDVISTNVDLVALRERGMALMQSVDVQTMVYNTLPEGLKPSYLEALGKNMKDLQPDYYAVLEKTNRKEALTPEDFKVLIDGVKALEGQGISAMKHAPLVAVFGSLQPKDRFELLNQMSQDPSFTSFDEVVVTMVASTYLTKDQAVLVLDSKIALLSATEKDKKQNATDLAALGKAREIIQSPEMEATQKAVVTRRDAGARRMGTMSYGHRDRVGGLLTFRGLGSALLFANGAISAGLNVMAAGFNPLNLIDNPAFWLSAAEVGASLQWSRGFEGLVAAPTELISKFLKDREEAEKEKVQTNLNAFKEELGNHFDDAQFYVNYAKKINDAYAAKKKIDPNAPPKITLEDLGVTKKEDLPEGLRSAYDKKAPLEENLSKWVTRFHRSSADGIGKATSEAQVTFMQEAYGERTQRTNGTKQQYTLFEQPASEPAKK